MPIRGTPRTLTATDASTHGKYNRFIDAATTIEASPFLADTLRELARRTWMAPQPGQALALIELAKENYRQLLRRDPDAWDARYTLERAQRLVPEPEQVDDAPPELNRNAERAATTMSAYAPGLP